MLTKATKRRGNPQVNLRITPGQLALLQRIGERRGLNIPQTIHIAIDFYIEQFHPESDTAGANKRRKRPG